MKPYYESGGITIYHGDCREILPEVSLSSDGIIGDPTYGIEHPTDYASRGRGALAATHDWQPIKGDDRPFEPQFLLSCGAWRVLWGANYYAHHLPPTSGWLVWDKRVHEGVGVNDQADGELAWTDCVKGVRIFRHMWNGFWRQSERGQAFHPMQKPAALMSWVLTKVPSAPRIVDPFMGSGPVLVACRAVNQCAIGIEIEERYCEIAARRLDQEVLAL